QPSGPPRVRIPFQPFFLQQVRAGQVASISTKGESVQGTFKTKLRYPPTSKTATPTTHFSTEIPAFWNDSQLSALLAEKQVEINAKSTTASQSLLVELLLGFGPTLLIVGLFVLLARRAAAAGGAMGALGSFGRSRARRVDPEKIRVTFADVAGIDEAKAELSAVVVLAATNRPDVLDSALLRPGRFDRRVSVLAPDRIGRRRILEVHTRSIPLDDGVDLEALAATTPGMVGADIANLANEAALLAARRGHEKVEMRDFTDSLEKIMLGSPRGIMLSPADRERTAH